MGEATVVVIAIELVVAFLLENAAWGVVVSDDSCT